MATPTDSKTPIKATCHCGAVQVQTPGKPPEINECQCSLCRRYAVAWGYYNPKEVTISASSPTTPYVWGDRMLEFHFCSLCGCVVYWKSIEASDEMGVNTRMMDPDAVRMVDRKIDFSQASVPLIAKEAAHVDDKARY